METTDLEEPELTCVEAFKQGDHDKALQLLPSLQQPAAVRTSYNIVPHIPDCLSTDVSLLHLAAFNGWMDIVAILVDKYGCSSQCCDSQGQTPLHYAAYGGSLLVVKYLITEQHCDKNSRGRCGRTPLHKACFKGHIDLIQYFITEQGCDPTLPDNNSSFPIHLACLGGQLSTVKYLITKQQCDSNSKGQNGLTPLHVACQQGHMDIVKYLITKQQCDPNSKGQNGLTPLHVACQQGRMDIIHCLITEFGCDPALPNNNGNMPIHHACLSGQLSTVKYLITEQHCDPNSKGQNGLTPLHVACQKGHMDVIHCLITEFGCDPALPNNNGNMPIHHACLSGQLSTVKYLITEQHCDPNSKGQNGLTPLHVACQKGHMDVIHCLITEFGCDPALPNNNGNMPIHIACLSGQLSTVKYLITEQHCDLNSKGQNGLTPLHVACQNGHIDTIHYLITELGCDPALSSNNGNMPIHIASLSGQLSIVKYLITEQHCDPNSKGQNGLTPLHVACQNGHIDTIHYLITELGCDLALSNNNGNMPIHIASLSGQLSTVRYLITEQYCDPNSRGQCGNVPLHFVCQSGHMDVIQYLITELGCDPALPNDLGNKPIHIACLCGQLTVVKYLITDQHCDPNSRGHNGWTLLHFACQNGHMDVIRYLTINKCCDPALPNNSGNMPIHKASICGQLKVVKYLIIEQHCDPNSRGKYGLTPLHYACNNRHMDIIQYLITELGCDPALPDNNGRMTLHIACLGGQLSVVKYLITEQHCDPNSRGQCGSTPLHFACQSGNMDVIQYLITELGCDPTVVNSKSMSLLHSASCYGHTHVVQWLLQDGRVDALSVDEHGRTPVDCAELSVNSYDLLKLFHPLLKSRKEYPIHSFTKVVFTGNSGAGKSSLAHIIVEQSAMNSHLYDDEEKIANVKTLTAGIDSYVLRSEKVGNMVLYDLAGQSEYYFSQSVIMETVMQNTPAVFINLVDLSKREEEIAQAVRYWLTFVENVTSKAKSKSCIVMVGSHIDLLSENELLTKAALLEDLVDRRKKKFMYEGFIGMDCRKTNKDNIGKFFTLLCHCQSTISTCSPHVSVYCHMLYSFLQTKVDKIACQFHDLISHFSAMEGSLIPPNESLIGDLLEYLGDKGLIIYLKNNQCLEKSWVVVKREVILKDVNGVLFKPKYFRGYRPIASSTGIIRKSSLSELFPQYDLEMLVELMIRLEFCHQVNLSKLNVKTNFEPIDGSDSTDNLLFFPCLLHAERPQTFSSDVQQSTSQQVGFGWCLGCMDYEYQFLTSRFLHVLLLRLAYTFPLPSKNYSKNHNLYRLEQRCTVWKNGISWNNEDGIRTVVEVIQQNRWVIVTMYHNKDITRPVEYSKHRSAVIKLVLDLQKELAPDLDTLECLISPSLLQQRPLECLSESDLFTIADVASSILHCTPIILSYKDGSNQLSTKEALFFEPYHLLSPSSVCELMDSSKSDQPVSPTLLNEVRECCQQPQLQSQSHLSLRKNLDNMSIFTGRNPLVSMQHTHV